MQVNLGSGDRYAPGWVNVDHQGCPHQKDLTVDLRGELPWNEGELKRVFMGHLLEHLKVHECISLLSRLRHVVAPGGEVMIVGPDLYIAEGMAVAGTLEVTLDSLRYGADRWGGDQHRWECSAYDITALLRASGWDNSSSIGINNVPADWPVADRNPQWQCAILVIR